MNSRVSATSQLLRTPRAAAIAGIAFALLLGTSIAIVRAVIPATPRGSGVWLSDPVSKNAIIIAINLVPFAGIAFLWFIGVLRDRMGDREDRFFATVFLGSGLLFVAMLFTSTALAGALIASVEASPQSQLQASVWFFARTITYTIITTYAMRMAAVFMIAAATISLRLAILPRWIDLLGYLIAAILLLVVGAVGWVELLFPFWILVVSVHTLLANLRSTGKTPADDETRKSSVTAMTGQ